MSYEILLKGVWAILYNVLLCAQKFVKKYNFIIQFCNHVTTKLFGVRLSWYKHKVTKTEYLYILTFHYHQSLKLLSEKVKSTPSSEFDINTYTCKYKCKTNTIQEVFINTSGLWKFKLLEKYTCEFLFSLFQ